MKHLAKQSVTAVCGDLMLAKECVANLRLAGFPGETRLVTAGDSSDQLAALPTVTGWRTAWSGTHRGRASRSRGGLAFACGSRIRADRCGWRSARSSASARLACVAWWCRWVDDLPKMVAAENSTAN